MRILYESRVWKRGLQDYICNWCQFAKDPNHPQHQKGLDHKLLNATQKNKYWETIRYDLQEDEFLQAIRIDFAGINIAPCEKWMARVACRFQALISATGGVGATLLSCCSAALRSFASVPSNLISRSVKLRGLVSIRHSDPNT